MLIVLSWREKIEHQVQLDITIGFVYRIRLGAMINYFGGIMRQAFDKN